jgi:hypothetical protein
MLHLLCSLSKTGDGLKRCIEYVLARIQQSRRVHSSICHNLIIAMSVHILARTEFEFSSVLSAIFAHLLLPTRTYARQTSVYSESNSHLNHEKSSG